MCFGKVHAQCDHLPIHVNLDSGSPSQVYINLYRSKKPNAAFYIDIRRKFRSGSTIIPSRAGVFLRQQEFFEMKQIYETWRTVSSQVQSEHQISSKGRRVLLIKHEQVFKICLWSNNNTKLSEIQMNGEEFQQLVSYDMNENLSLVLGNNICKICFNLPQEVLYLPCRHFVSCRGCDYGMTSCDRNENQLCPICRQTIVDKVNVIRA